MFDLKTTIAENRNYVIIALLSILAVFFLPFLGTTVGLEWNIPNTTAGWIVYVVTKLCIVIINMLIFDQFMKRAKINVKDNPWFKKAEEILVEKDDTEEPILPAEYYINKMYRSKMITTVVFTILGVIGFSNAVLTFDWVSMLTYIFTILIALVFGWISMAEAEQVWIEKHYKYAKKVQLERQSKAMVDFPIENTMKKLTRIND